MSWRIIYKNRCAFGHVYRLSKKVQPSEFADATQPLGRVRGAGGAKVTVLLLEPITQ